MEWLKIHLVNLTGLKKKSSNAERLEFANEVLPLAIQSASSPFEVDYVDYTLFEVDYTCSRLIIDLLV